MQGVTRPGGLSAAAAVLSGPNLNALFSRLSTPHGNPARRASTLKIPTTLPTLSSCISPSTPAQLFAAHPGLLGTLAPLLAPSAPQLAAGADRVQLLATEILSELLGPGTFGEDAEQERAALEGAIAALLTLRGAALAPSGAGAAAARGVGAVASALAERDAELVCGVSGGALALAEVMLQCVQRPEREVRGRVGLDVWCSVW